MIVHSIELREPYTNITSIYWEVAKQTLKLDAKITVSDEKNVNYPLEWAIILLKDKCLNKTILVL